MRPPAELSTLTDLLARRTRESPEMCFACFGGRELSYAEFDDRTSRLAGGLAELGVGPGDVVSVLLPNCLEFLQAWWAILKVGGVFGPVNPAYTSVEAGYVLGHSRAVAVITDAAGAVTVAEARAQLPQLREVITVGSGTPGAISLDELAARSSGTPDPGRRPGDLASILYTSGTTGRPKGAMLTHANLLVNTVQVAELVPLAPGDRVGMILPLFHANAQLATTLMPMMIGAEIMMWERFSASTFWATVAELAPVTISAVPTILAAVLNAPGAPGPETSLRYVICGAAPLSVELLRAFSERFGITVLEGYGLTETACVASLNPYYGERKVGSIGLPLRGQRMEIRTDDGRPAAPGEYGEIVIAGPNVMAGYLDNPEATAETIREGWLHTGDVGLVDEDGYFYIVDRSKDMIIRGGENIYPREIEEVLYGFGGVLECAVIGVPDAVRGEEVLAVVVPGATGGLDLEALGAHAAQRLARYKLPREYILRDALPKTPTGKIAKGPLREEFGSWSAGRVPELRTEAAQAAQADGPARVGTPAGTGG
ncbi:MAG TPA: AMP-binding protein [Solirubrobacteraceae bacterium]|nr:AMP-binding protein [Solirubrobacteraceae bacterium]